jgi:hypothetical protein
LPPGSIDPGPPPKPEHPIVLPPTPPGSATDTPSQPIAGGWVWIYSPVYGWVLMKGGVPPGTQPGPPPTEPPAGRRALAP